MQLRSVIAADRETSVGCHQRSAHKTSKRRSWFTLAYQARSGILFARRLMRHVSVMAIVLGPLPPWASSPGNLRRAQLTEPGGFRDVTLGLTIGDDRGHQAGSLKL